MLYLVVSAIGDPFLNNARASCQTICTNKCSGHPIFDKNAQGFYDAWTYSNGFWAPPSREAKWSTAVPSTVRDNETYYSDVKAFHHPDNWKGPNNPDCPPGATCHVELSDLDTNSNIAPAVRWEKFNKNRAWFYQNKNDKHHNFGWLMGEVSHPHSETLYLPDPVDPPSSGLGCPGSKTYKYVPCQEFLPEGGGIQCTRSGANGRIFLIPSRTNSDYYQEDDDDCSKGGPPLGFTTSWASLPSIPFMPANPAFLNQYCGTVLDPSRFHYVNIAPPMNDAVTGAISPQSGYRENALCSDGTDSGVWRVMCEMRFGEMRAGVDGLQYGCVSDQVYNREFFGTKLGGFTNIQSLIDDLGTSAGASYIYQPGSVKSSSTPSTHALLSMGGCGCVTRRVTDAMTPACPPRPPGAAGPAAPAVALPMGPIPLEFIQTGPTKKLRKPGCARTGSGRCKVHFPPDDHLNDCRNLTNKGSCEANHSDKGLFPSAETCQWTQHSNSTRPQNPWGVCTHQNNQALPPTPDGKGQPSDMPMYRR
jgi:hypothetical protein